MPLPRDRYRPLEIAAQKGDKQAQYDLGLCYENGRGVEKNLTEAANCFRKAAEQSHKDSHTKLGFYYQHGIAVEKDFKKAEEHYRKAAKENSPYLTHEEMLRSAQKPLLLPSGQSEHPLYQKLIARTSPRGMCQGDTVITRTAYLHGQRKKAEARKYAVNYGLPFYPEAPNSKERVRLSHLQQIIDDYELEPIIEEHKLMSAEGELKNPPTENKNSDEEITEARGILADVITSLELDDVPQTTYTQNSIAVVRDGQLITDKIIPQIPLLPKDEIIQQIKKASAIRAAYSLQIKAQYKNKKIDQQEVDRKMAEFDKNFPFLLELINIKAYFCSTAVLHSPEYYWITTESLNQHDYQTAHKIVAPIIEYKEGRSHAAEVSEIARFHKTYSYDQLTSYFASLEKRIVSYLEKNENNFAAELTDFPLTISLSARSHIFPLGYNKKTKKWIVMDINASPSYEVDTTEIAKHILNRLTFSTNFVEECKGLKFKLQYDKNENKMFLMECVWNEEEAKKSPHYEKIKKAYNKLKAGQCTRVKDITAMPIFVKSEIHCHPQFQSDLQQLITEWQESPEFKKIHELNLENKLDTFNPKLEQPTSLSAKIDFLKKLHENVVNLPESQFNQYLEKEGKEIDTQIKNAENYFQFAEIFRHIPNQKFGLEIIKRACNAQAIQHILLLPWHFSKFKYFLGNDTYALDIKKAANLPTHSLCEAAMHGNLAYAKYILEETKSTTKEILTIDENNPGSNALHYAAYYEHLEVLQYLTKQLSANETNESGNTPLFLAVSMKNIECVRCLVEAKADMHINNNKGESAFTLAMKNKDTNKNSAAIADFLFWHDVKNRLKPISPQSFIKFFNDEGKSLSKAILLMINTGEQLIEILNILPTNLLVPFVERFANKIFCILNSTEKLAKFSQDYQNEPIKKMIFQIKKNKENFRCCEAAMDGNVLEVKECVELLKVDPTLTIDQKDQPGSNPFHLAAMHGHLEVVKYLAPKVNIEEKNNLHNTALHTCMFGVQSLEVVKYLVVDRKADMHCKNKAGLSPFSIAIKNKDTSPAIADFMFWQDVKLRLPTLSPDNFNHFFNSNGKTLADAIPLMIDDVSSLVKLLRLFKDKSIWPLFIKRFDKLFKKNLANPQSFNKFLAILAKNPAKKAQKNDLTDDKIIMKVFADNKEFLLLAPELIDTFVKKYNIDLLEPDSRGLTLLQYAIKHQNVSLQEQCYFAKVRKKLDELKNEYMSISAKTDTNLSGKTAYSNSIMKQNILYEMKIFAASVKVECRMDNIHLSPQFYEKVEKEIQETITSLPTPHALVNHGMFSRIEKSVGVSLTIKPIRISAKYNL